MVCDELAAGIVYNGKNWTQNTQLEYYMNKDVLSRTFKKKYGVGLTSYINHIRLEQAKAYLLAGYSSTQAAELVGYHDVNYFSRIFKKAYGISPSKYASES